MYLISACLCGVNCKYNGENNLNKDCLKLLEEDQAILICPEQLGGLTTPRKPAEIIDGTAKDIIDRDIGKVITKEGKDVTESFIRGAKETINIAKLSGTIAAILKEGSPSCGCNYIYDGSFSGNKIEGEGITAYMLKEAGIEVISDEEYSKKVEESNKLIFLSDYEFKRKENEFEDDNYDGAIVYSIIRNDEEIITDLPENVEKNMKRLIITMAKEMFGLETIEDIEDATGFTKEEIKEILEEDKDK
ncbi:DUF523 domain-containing protein [Clostridium sp. SHJSY1]|uniref:DUF523 domain-containing protein n=1 Tax=Clostridium sp. SHJSY1 TaxID=2942483 RepID=UPI0028768C7E|nr:DUF523 domain-containing protein [Clostridium sp. SHJSY1]MDS0527487.1 DUF523 domain-containing protein [Clostridium sp. SHJSY1]